MADLRFDRRSSGASAGRRRRTAAGPVRSLSPVDQLLALQRSAGNRVTMRRVSPFAPIQRLRYADPAVETHKDPAWAPGGAYAWTVKMTAKDETEWPAFIIQKVHRTQRFGPAETGGNELTFWEAFPVDGRKVLGKDTFQDDVGEDEGAVEVKGLLQHHKPDGDAQKPEGMSAGAVTEADREQYSSYDAPPFWGAGGTPHDLAFAWNKGGLVRWNTDPQSSVVGKKDFKEVRQTY